MTDLFTKDMPPALRDKLYLARLELEAVAKDIDAFLARFFEETWASCQRVYEVEHQGKTLTVPGTPDFNEFDRVTDRFKKKVANIRWMLWDIDAEAKGRSEPSASTVEKEDS